MCAAFSLQYKYWLLILSELYKLAKEREHHDHDYATLPVSADTSLFIPNYIVM